MNLEGVPTTWAKTRTYYLNSLNWAQSADFGLGNEQAFTCPRCNRKLPRHIVTVDHVVSQAQMSQAIDGYVDNNGNVPGGLDWSQYTIQGNNSTVISKGSNEEKIKAKSFIYKYAMLDLNNLTVMCSLCNTSKNST